ncbi:retropepsin-like aspartic protease family protein [Microvirga lotononidis]|uniref:Clan AA aspartic protease, TIGR02281 family n=1 Tax=Microvirga lotononidis TaxID=864069 RepID=I4YNA1_9HYPH|nr:TIGR02281 family clan AA aspartic protease [Microvirga lotononidis]EIM25443.1 clan AA aspartic protease, TIGR02281 family [Microvirga lotononidis]WQO26244.1 TIGR02281 family clan AA aspartic protease [Microvirga lotononidis]
MPGIRGAGLLLLLAALLVGLFVNDSVGAFSALEASGLLALGGLCLLMAASIVEGFSRHWTYGIQSIAVSGGILVALLVTYASRGELQAVIDRAIGDIAVGRTVVTPEGEVVAARRTDGSFMVQGEVNGHETRFVFDTGASTVVLRAENAAALGFRPDNLNYSVPVATANGGALAAPVMIDRLTVGPITERRVRALIAREGVLHANLLGMTFLERLGSYEVRGNRLILRARTGS